MERVRFSPPPPLAPPPPPPPPLQELLFFSFLFPGRPEGLKPEQKRRNENKTALLRTFFSSNTIDEYPDIFTLNIGSVVNLDGITLLSGSDGWILNYTVDTSLDGASWNLAATVELSNTVLRFIRFDNGPLKVKQLRISITAAQNEYSRIMELLPVYAAASISATDPRATSTSTHSSASTARTTTATVTKTPISNTPSPATSGAESNTVKIVAGVLGGLAAILLGTLAYFVWLLRTQRNSVVGTGDEGTGQGVAVLDGSLKNTVSGFSYHSNVASGIGGQDLQEAGGYPRMELP